MTCTHQDMIEIEMPSDDDKRSAACPACVEAGDSWVHLRQCLTCGNVGCCDDSPNRHARRHAEDSEHPIVTSYETGEHWRYCFIDREPL